MASRFIALAAAASVASAHGGHQHNHQHHDDHNYKGLRAKSRMDDVNLVAVPFNLSSVQLKQGSKFDVMRTANRLFLLNLNSSSLMCLYSSAANLTGSWAHPDGCVPYSHPGYWGHYLGHYLSATALLIASNTSATGDVELLGKTQAMVSYLGQVQDAWTQLGPAYDGFLFPYDRYTFDTLFGVYGPVQYCAPVCVPFYIFHKVMAGMLDQYTLAGNAQALTIAINMARWARTNIEAVIARGGQQLWQAVLNVEWGGMNDALFNLYRITGDPDHLATAERFNHFIWTAPLAAGQDNLGGFHANTHIPEVIGDVNGYEITSNATKLAIGTTFFRVLQEGHAYATGGSNDHEMWWPAWSLGSQIDDSTEESCTQYNMLKVSRLLFQLEGGARYGDYYERALLNGLIGNQNREGQFAPDQNPNTVGFIYFLPLGGAVQKAWGDGVEGGFPCCWGTLSETFAKLQDSIYFQSPPGTATPSLYVHLYVPSTVTTPWGAVVSQETSYPEDPDSTTTITVDTSAMAPSGPSFTLAVRVPFWAVPSEAVITVNGGPAAPASSIVPQDYFNITLSPAQCKAGCSVSVFFPQHLRWEPLQDNRTAFAQTGALMYGSILLAAVTPHTYLPLPPVGQLPTVIYRDTTNTSVLRFVTTASACGNVTLMPLYDIMFETYSVYLNNATSTPPVPFPGPGAASSLTGDAATLQMGGGAGVQSNGAASNIRSGNPGETSTAQWLSPVQDASGKHKIVGVSMPYSYVPGYGPAGASGGAVMQLIATTNPCAGPTGATVLYTSPALSGSTDGQSCSFDTNPTAYCTMAIDVPVQLDVSAPTTFALVFTNNNRNVQVLLPLNLTLTWSA